MTGAAEARTQRLASLVRSAIAAAADAAYDADADGSARAALAEAEARGDAAEAERIDRDTIAPGMGAVGALAVQLARAGVTAEQFQAFADANPEAVASIAGVPMVAHMLRRHGAHWSDRHRSDVAAPVARVERGRARGGRARGVRRRRTTRGGSRGAPGRPSGADDGDPSPLADRLAAGRRLLARLASWGWSWWR